MDKSTGIEIENIPASISCEDLVELFEKELKHENEINYILFPLPGNRNKAFVCFKHSPDKAFIDRLVAYNPLWNVKVDSRMQTYCSCTAEVDALIVASIPDIPACIAMLRKDYGIAANYDEDSGKFLLKGMLPQLQCAQNRLDSIFEEQKALQGIQFLQIGKSDDTSVKRRSLDFAERREAVSSTAGVTLRQDYMKELARDVRNEKRSLLVDDQFESVQTRPSEKWDRPSEKWDRPSEKWDRPSEKWDRPSEKWDQYSQGSEYRSLPSTLSFQHDDQKGVRRYEQDPLTASDRALILPSFDPDQSNRRDEPQSLLRFPYATSRCAEDLPRSGDHRFSAPFEWHDRVKHHSLSEYTGGSDRLFSNRREGSPTYASVPRDKEHTAVTYSRTPDDDWHKETVYTPGLSGIHREYQSTYTSRTRTSPTSGLLPSRESVHEDSTLPGRTQSRNSDQHDGRHKGDDSIGSSYMPAFWKERQNVAIERLNSLPLSLSVDSPSRLDCQPKDPGQGAFSHSQMSFVTSVPRYLMEERSDRIGDFNEDPDTSAVTTSENQATLFLETYVTKYIMTVKKGSVYDIKQRHKVETKVSTEPGADFSTVIFHGKHADQVEKASKKFARLYEETFNDIIQREVNVNADLPEVIDVIERAQKMYRVILITDTPGTVTIVGEFRDVMKAVDLLNSVQSEIEARDPQRGSGGFDIASRIARSSAGGQSDLDETLPKRQDSEKTTSSCAAEISRLAKRSTESPDVTEDLKSSSSSFQSIKEKLRDVGDVELIVKEPRSQKPACDSTQYRMTFEGNFQVFIYTGDIAKLRVDAIVNAANSLLRNYSGVAGALEEAGGPQFREDCDNLYRSHGPLQVSEAVHTAASGNLRCHNVIHTVGPTWYLDSDEDRCADALLATFKNVLNYAEKTLKATSLALPAVGTGIFGVPIDVCARAIYGAVCEFLEDSSSSSSPLKSLHVVNKDPGTTELIQAVFEGLRQLELEQRTKTTHDRSPADDEKLSEPLSFDPTSNRRSSEREPLDSVNRHVERPDRNQTRVLTELGKNFSSHSGSEADDSESHVVRQRVTRETPETVDVTSKQGYHPIFDSDSDEF